MTKDFIVLGVKQEKQLTLLYLWKMTDEHATVNAENFVENNAS